jgi:hypothetical protein
MAGSGPALMGQSSGFMAGVSLRSGTFVLVPRNLTLDRVKA